MSPESEFIFTPGDGVVLHFSRRVWRPGFLHKNFNELSLTTRIIEQVA